MLKRLLIAASFLILCSCAANSPSISQHYVWPTPPDQPRIEWLTGYSSQHDLEMTPFRNFRETIVGEDKPIFMKRPVFAKHNADSDKLYVADIDYPAVIIFDLKEKDLKILPIDTNALKSEIIKPISLDFDKQGNLYILDSYTKSILVYDNKDQFEKILHIAKDVDRPVSILFNSFTEQFFVSDAQASRIIVFDKNGSKLFSFGKFGEGEGEFNRPAGITILSTGEIVVADAFNARIQIFDKNGKFIRMFGRRGDLDDSFQLIKGVASDPDDNIYVTDARSNNIKIFDKIGTPLLAIGGFYSAKNSGKSSPGGFAVPGGIAINKDGIISVADQLNARVQVFRYLPVKSSNSVK